ncbi:MAG: M48 family metallopeptidase [Candidatus Adiutrix sp.]|jgi:predicted Zn-dependent protease|nr:M48 family metallopeptidase [Candidatus Adiutrix sp.]
MSDYPRRLFCSLAVLGAYLLLSACAVVPGTGRSQLSLVSDKELSTMAAGQYAAMIKQGPLSTNQKDTATIKKVGARISRASETFLREQGLEREIGDYKWEFNLIESDQVNAFCMPGGKVAFYTGILPFTQGETGVAVIMGHEVAHAIAHHSRERASQQALTNLGGQILSVGLGVGGASGLTGDLAMAAYGLGSQVGVLLPFSRAHESEADRIGLTLMALAGYDPAQAVAFWRRMSEKQGGSTPEFLSTHPSDKTRVANIERYLPEARRRYKK